MKFNFSLDRIWITLTLISTVIPVVALTYWFVSYTYKSELSASLIMQSQESNSLRDRVSAEVKRLQTLLQNKSDPVGIFIRNGNQLNEVNILLKKIIQREPAIHEVFLINENAEIITSINSVVNLNDRSNKKLGIGQQRWTKKELKYAPEYVIPFKNEFYIGAPTEHDGDIDFSISVQIHNSIGDVQAVLIAYIHLDELWQAVSIERKKIIEEDSYNYAIDQHGVLLTANIRGGYKVADIMTHLPIVRSGLANKSWPADRAYIGLSKETVFGILTFIPSLDWILVSEVTESSITEPIILSLTTIVIVTLCAITAFIVLILYLVKQTLIPVDRLQLAIDSLSKGDYRFVVTSSGIAELDEIGESFNRMVVNRKESEEEILLAEKKATQANNAKSEFLSNMSHELRTPLNAIMGFSQLLQMDVEDEQQLENVNDIFQAGEHLLMLINGMLDLSAIEAGKLKVNVDNHDVNKIILESVLLIRPLAEKRNIQIINNICAVTNYKVIVDAVRLKQILLNLLANAVKFNNEGGTISLGFSVDAENYLRINVNDTGIGIAEDQFELLFSSFERVEDKNNVEGSGIGLAVTKGLVELMGGSIGVESEVGKGSTFWFKVKLA